MGQRSKPCDSDRRHSTCRRAEFREIGHALVDQIADRLTRLPAGPVLRDESPADVRRALGTEQTLPLAGSSAAQLVERDGRTAVRPLGVQRPPALLRVHHGESGAHRHVRRLPGGGVEPERRGVAAVAACHRDRTADRSMDCRADRLPRRLWRAAGQRRQHGQLHLPDRGASRQGRRRCAQGGPCARGSAPDRVCVSGGAYVAAESR